jgi:hypothetical protein
VIPSCHSGWRVSANNSACVGDSVVRVTLARRGLAQRHHVATLGY